MIDGLLQFSLLDLAIQTIWLHFPTHIMIHWYIVARRCETLSLLLANVLGLSVLILIISFSPLIICISFPCVPLLHLWNIAQHSDFGNHGIGLISVVRKPHPVIIIWLIIRFLSSTSIRMSKLLAQRSATSHPDQKIDCQQQPSLLLL